MTASRPSGANVGGAVEKSRRSRMSRSSRRDARSRSLRGHVRAHGRARQPQAVPGHPVHARRRSPKRRSAPTTRAPRWCTSTRATTTARPRSRPATFARDQGGGAEALPDHPQLLDGHDPRRRAEQCTYIRESRPEIAALNMGTMNYSKYSREAEGVRLRHGLPEHVREDHQAARGDERGRA